jgi:hypothetical protein
LNQTLNDTPIVKTSAAGNLVAQSWRDPGTLHFRGRSFMR